MDPDPDPTRYLWAGCRHPRSAWILILIRLVASELAAGIHAAHGSWSWSDSLPPGWLQASTQRMDPDPDPTRYLWAGCRHPRSAWILIRLATSGLAAGIHAAHGSWSDSLPLDWLQASTQRMDPDPTRYLRAGCTHPRSAWILIQLTTSGLAAGIHAVHGSWSWSDSLPPSWLHASKQRMDPDPDPTRYLRAGCTHPSSAWILIRLATPGLAAGIHAAHGSWSWSNSLPPGWLQASTQRMDPDPDPTRYLRAGCRHPRSSWILILIRLATSELAAGIHAEHGSWSDSLPPGWLQASTQRMDPDPDPTRYLRAGCTHPSSAWILIRLATPGLAAGIHAAMDPDPDPTRYLRAGCRHPRSSWILILIRLATSGLAAGIQAAHGSWSWSDSLPPGWLQASKQRMDPDPDPTSYLRAGCRHPRSAWILIRLATSGLAAGIHAAHGSWSWSWSDSLPPGWLQASTQRMDPDPDPTRYLRAGCRHPRSAWILIRLATSGLAAGIHAAHGSWSWSDSLPPDWLQASTQRMDPDPTRYLRAGCRHPSSAWILILIRLATSGLAAGIHAAHGSWSWSDSLPPGWLQASTQRMDPDPDPTRYLRAGCRHPRRAWILIRLATSGLAAGIHAAHGSLQRHCFGSVRR